MSVGHVRFIHQAPVSRSAGIHALLSGDVGLNVRSWDARPGWAMPRLGR